MIANDRLPGQRMRRRHNKVRSGCLTCKVRRKKCDEGRPACLRCTKAGKRCEGYALVAGVKVGIVTNGGKRSVLVTDSACITRDFVLPHVPQVHNEHSILSPLSQYEPYEDLTRPKGVADHTLVVAQPHFPYPLADNHGTQSQLVIPRGPKNYPNIPEPTDTQAHCFSFFRHRTLPQLASYFESSIWQSEFIQVALVLTHPALYLAVVALGAVHRRYSLGISPQAFEYCGHAKEFYHQAVQALTRLEDEHRKRKSDHKPPPSRVAGYETSIIATSEIVLGVFQSFQAEPEASKTHIQSGLLRFIERPQQLLHSESWQLAGPAKPRVLCRLMHQVYCRMIDLLGTPLEVESAESATTYAPPPMPEKFKDLEEMRDRLFIELNWIWHSKGREFPDPTLREQMQYTQECRLAEWSEAYAKTVSNPKLTETSWKRQALNLMHIARSAACFLGYVTLFIEEHNQNTPMPNAPVVKAPDEDGPEAERERHVAEIAEILGDAVNRSWRKGVTYSLRPTKQKIDELLNKQPIFVFEQMGDQHMETLMKGQGKTIAIPPASTVSRFGDASDLVAVYSIARNISEVIEEATIHLVKPIIPTGADMQFVDIGYVSLESRRVLLRYYIPNEINGGQWWTQEWWTF